MGFIMVPDEAMDNLRLSSTDKLVMGVITSLTTKSDYCYANNDYFSNKVHVSKRIITNSLSKLIKENLIEIKYDNDHRKIYPKIRKNTSRGIEENCYPPIEENFYHNKYNNNIKNNKKIMPIPIWMEHPEMCKRKVPIKEEQDEMNKLLSEYK
ncbi:MAG: helix-turn-helix domain-containing protein [Bacilli bacterium]|nr:helix-turn-helix domain-containing protein [Bacilli bacterium]